MIDVRMKVAQGVEFVVEVLHRPNRTYYQYKYSLHTMSNSLLDERGIVGHAFLGTDLVRSG